MGKEGRKQPFLSFPPDSFFSSLAAWREKCKAIFPLTFFLKIKAVVFPASCLLNILYTVALHSLTIALVNVFFSF